MLSVGSNKSNKFVNFLMKNGIRSCSPLVDKVKSLRDEYVKNFEALEKVIFEEKKDKLLLIKNNYGNNPDYISKINDFFEKKFNDDRQKFEAKLEIVESNVIEMWLLNNKNCLVDIVSYTETRVLDTIKGCVIGSLDELGLSGCENNIKNLIDSF